MIRCQAGSSWQTLSCEYSFEVNITLPNHYIHLCPSFPQPLGLPHVHIHPTYFRFCPWLKSCLSWPLYWGAPRIYVHHSTVSALLLDAIEGTPTILCKYHPLIIIVNLCGFLAVSLLVVHQQKNSLHHILGVVVVYFCEIVLQLFDNFTISCQVRSAR